MDDILTALAKLPSELQNGLGPEPLGKLAHYVEMLARWTKKVDLVANATTEVLIARHIEDSLWAGKLLSETLSRNSTAAYLDVGSGAGLPGIVLAVMAPKRTVFLCEPREKRVFFLKEVRRELGLDNIGVIGKRLEDIKREEVPNVCLIIERALGGERQFLEKSGELLSEEGLVVQMVGPSWCRRINDLKLGNGLRLNFKELVAYKLSLIPASHQLAVWVAEKAG